MFMCVVNLKSVNKLDLTWKQPFLIQGWKGLPRTNTLAYYKTLVNYGRKKFCKIGSLSKIRDFHRF
jgi:hypothetical protein